MTDEADPSVPVICDACGTSSSVPLSAVADAVERHNERLHDGESVAEVDPDLRDELVDLVAEDLDLV